MLIRLPCETYFRLMPIATTDNDQNEPYFKAMYVERKNGLTVAITTNRRVAAIEKIPDADIDGSALIMFHDGLFRQCQTEIGFGGHVEIAVIEMMEFATAKTTFGFSINENIGVFPKEHLFAHWRSWLPPKPVTETGKGGMFWTWQHIAALGASAPSGYIRFPQHIDTAQSVIVNDAVDPKWLGVFKPNYKDDDNKVKVAEPATLPDWIGK